MEYRRLGRTGLKVSPLCLGTMQFGWTCSEKDSFKIMDSFVAAGGNFLDTADIYSNWAEGNSGGVSEEIIGRWLKERGNRSQVIVATKVRGKMGETPNDQGLSRQHILNAVDASLKRLQTDYIDLYQTHWYDDETPIDETLQVLDDLVRAGKIRYVGASNYPAWLLMEALWTSDRMQLSRYDSLQPYYNLVDRAEFERELLPTCKKYGIGVIPYSPLAAGFLTGKYQKGQTLDSVRYKSVEKRYFHDKGWQILDQVSFIARERNQPKAAVTLAWLLHNPVISSPIIGANSLEQLGESLPAAEFKLTQEEYEKLDDLSKWQE